MAVDWTRHGRRLAKITYAEFSTLFAAELADLCSAYPNRSAADVVSDTFDLHRRHGEAVRTAVAQAIEDNRWAAVDGSIPGDSLLAAVFTDAVSNITTSVRGDATPGGTNAAMKYNSLRPRGTGVVFPLRIALVPAGPRLSLWVGGLGRLEGAHWSLIEKLKPHHDEATRVLRDHSQHRYVPTRLLGKQGTVGQQARRCREAITAECGKRDVSVPPGEPLVQSKKHHGYRIDSEARFVDDLTELFD